MMKAGQTLNVVVSGKGKSIFWSEVMNDRIREFAEQSVGSRPYNTFDYEKFAELIVRECANLPFKSTGEVTTIGEIAVSNMILKHFGVEE